jgi:hypothetical protein
VVDLEEPPPHGATDRPADIRTLIRTMAQANPRWGALRIHGEPRIDGVHGGQITGTECAGRLAD